MLKTIYQNVGENIVIGLIGPDGQELEGVINSFYNYGLIEPPRTESEDIDWFLDGNKYSRFGPKVHEKTENFRYVISTQEKLERYLFISSLFIHLNDTGEELDEHDNPTPAQTAAAIKISENRKNTWQRLDFYPTAREYSNMEPDIFEEEKILTDNLNYER